MPNIKVEVYASKELYEVGDAVASLLHSIIEKSKDGLSPAEVAGAITENLEKCLSGISGVELISEELKNDPKAFANACALIGAKIVGSFLK